MSKKPKLGKNPNVDTSMLFDADRQAEVERKKQELARVWKEEQFGPLIPIAPFSSEEQIYSYLAESTFGQQAAVFAKDVSKIGGIVDALTLSVGRVNVNAQCQRGPDTFPFTGRKSSALGTLSVSEALKTVSIESVIAMKDSAEGNADLATLAASESCNQCLPLPVDVA